MWRPEGGFLTAAIPKDWITPVTAALIPVSMILGFFLNTFSWKILNPRMRRRSEAMLEQTIYAVLRTKLSETLCSESRQYFNTFAPPFIPAQTFDRPALEYYYLPRVKLTNLNYLWESYFCWYEFHINSACALALLGPATAFLLIVKLRECSFSFFGLIFLLLAANWGVSMALTRSAVKNLASYEKNLVLLITGSLVESLKPGPAVGEETTTEDGET